MLGGPLIADRVTDCCLCVYFQLESLNQSELASRLTLNCQNSYIEPHKIKDVSVTIMDVGFFTFYNKNIINHSIWFCFGIIVCVCTFRYSIRALFQMRQKRKCISCTRMPGELTSKPAATFLTFVEALKLTFTSKWVIYMLQNKSVSFLIIVLTIFLLLLFVWLCRYICVSSMGRDTLPSTLLWLVQRSLRSKRAIWITLKRAMMNHKKINNPPTPTHSLHWADLQRYTSQAGKNLLLASRLFYNGFNQKWWT